MIDVTELLTVLQAAIAGDSSLSSWCTSNCARAQTVYVGINLDNPPDRYSYPMVALAVPDVSGGVGAEDTSARLLIATAIWDDASPVTVGNRTTLHGVKTLEEFRKKVVQLVADNLPEGCRPVGVQVETEPLDSWPYFAAYTEIIMSRPWYVRENRIF